MTTHQHCDQWSPAGNITECYSIPLLVLLLVIVGLLNGYSDTVYLPSWLVLVSLCDDVWSLCDDQRSSCDDAWSSCDDVWLLVSWKADKSSATATWKLQSFSQRCHDVSSWHQAIQLSSPEKQSAWAAGEGRHGKSAELPGQRHAAWYVPHATDSSKHCYKYFLNDFLNH